MEVTEPSSGSIVLKHRVTWRFCKNHCPSSIEQISPFFVVLRRIIFQKPLLPLTPFYWSTLMTKWWREIWRITRACPMPRTTLRTWKRSHTRYIWVFILPASCSVSGCRSGSWWIAIDIPGPLMIFGGVVEFYDNGNDWFFSTVDPFENEILHSMRHLKTHFL